MTDTSTSTSSSGADTTALRTIGFIGAGNIGGTLARLAVAAGYDVVVSNSRGPETLTDLVSELGDPARAATSEEAAEAGDLVVVTIPLKAYGDVPVAPLEGKVVVDTGNYYPERDGQVAELDDESTTTSELLQRHLEGARVVKAFGNIFYGTLATLPRPAGAGDRTALPIAGDDEDAKAVATAFLDKIGYDAFDAGPLAEGWRWQRDTAAYGLYAGPGGMTDAQPRSAAEVQEFLGRAQRYRDMG